MPGAWEVQPTVLAYSLHTDVVTMAWAAAFRQLIIPGKFIALAGMPFDHARNQASMMCLDGGFDYSFSLDSDVICPPDTILRLIKHGLPIVSGMYCRRSPPHSIPVMQRPVGQWITQFPQGQLVEVETVGAGCLLVHRSVLEKMPAQRPQAGKHWYDWRVDCKGVANDRQLPLSEDYTMCVHAKQTLGIPTVVDTSIQCKHIGLAEFTYGKVEPLNGWIAA